MAKRTSSKRLDKPLGAAAARRGWTKPPHMPTEEEIAAGCRLIKADWDETEYRKRAGILPIYSADVQTVHVGPAARIAFHLGGVD